MAYCIRSQHSESGSFWQIIQEDQKPTLLLFVLATSPETDSTIVVIFRCFLLKKKTLNRGKES